MENLKQPQKWLWTRNEYYRAAECGVFHPMERLELLNGEILRKASPQSVPHTIAVLRSAEVMRQVFSTGFHVREEKPLALSDCSEPEPNIVVVRGTWRETPDHPTPANAVLVMEVSDSTLAFDQGEKAAAYARAGIEDYWLLNLRQRRLEVRRDPGALSDDEQGYRTLLILTPGMSIAPLAAPHSQVAVNDLLPNLSANEETPEA